MALLFDGHGNTMVLDMMRSMSFLLGLEKTDEYGTFIEITDIIDEAILHDKYNDEMLMVDMSKITDDVQLKTASPLNLLGILAIEMVKDVQLVPAPGLLTVVAHDDDIFEGVTSPVVVEFEHVDPLLSFDVLLDLSPVLMIDQRVSPTTRDAEIVDFGTTDQSKELRIGLDLSTDERDSLAQPIKLKLRRLHPRSLQVKDEIQKQLSVGLSVVEYPEWLANVVPIPKNDDLDGSKGHAKDVFHYRVGYLLLQSDVVGLKNAEATYQRGTTTFFHDMMHQDVEAYVDNMIVKSRDRVDHLVVLERFFEMIRQFRLRLNPKKCTFGVTSRKLLGYMVSEKGIKADPDKIRVVLEMPASRIEREIRDFLGRL
ncbi:Retrovirus-related Pol polyprotein from transposon 297 [Vitis vinifera]|uniref:Retrovirus-related Pol polyprotein from transposon 297 n=1 Tax=Vitis vinifera TaxID=29760 RepID=A0A438GMW4_VITVI|nr:Retrovirus-related Pol polyprotein from transposon 297 [Vitis vinifera]